jgi:hypothetical protein
MEKSKTQRAIELVEAGTKPYAAAREVGLAPNALYLALKRRRELQPVESCPCCGTLVPGEKINRGVLKDGQ